jgi:hypothetical protein
MPQREENLAKTTWILVRDGVEQGIFTLQQLHDLTLSGHLLPLDLLREAGSKELLPAWRVRGSNRGPGEPKTPHTLVPKALPVMPSHLQRKMHWVNRWQSRRLQLGLACLVGLVVGLSGPWLERQPGYFHLNALLATVIGVVGVVFFAWPGRFFATASAILSLVALTPVALMATGQATVGWGLITCGASCVALGLASLARMKACQ